MSTQENETIVDFVYDSLTPAQRAHLFNKLLKHQDYNAASVSRQLVFSLAIEVDAHRIRNSPIPREDMERAV